MRVTERKVQLCTKSTLPVSLFWLDGSAKNRSIYSPSGTWSELIPNRFINSNLCCWTMLLLQSPRRFWGFRTCFSHKGNTFVVILILYSWYPGRAATICCDHPLVWFLICQNKANGRITSIVQSCTNGEKCHQIWNSTTQSSPLVLF